VPLLQTRETPHVQGKYKSNKHQGFCNAPVVDPVGHEIEGAITKVVALGGMHRDARVPKWWILFR
jgi:hypothetical protein